jgi:hypothetical protein
VIISLILASVALLLVFGLGFGVSTVLFRKTRSVSLVEIITLSWLFGAGAISLSLWLFGMLLRGVSLQMAVALVAVGFSVIGIAQLRRNKVSVRFSRPRNWIEFTLALVLCLEIALVFLLTFKHTLGWDGLVIWELKARYAYLNGGALPVAYFSDATRVFSHPEYPLFLPMLETWLYFWIGDCDQYWIKLISPIFYVTGVIFVGQAASSWSGKRWIGLVAANLFLLVPFLTRMSGGVVLGYADVPLSVFYFVAFIYLLKISRGDFETSLPVFILLAAMLPWIKREGIVLWFVVAACGSFMIWRRGIWRAALALLPGLAVIVGWQIYLAAMHASPARDFLSVGMSSLRSNFHRLGPVIVSLMQEATTISHWSLLWFGAPLALFCIVIRDRSLRATLLVICSVAPLAFYCCVYVFSAWPDYLQHAQTSLPRLLWHIAPLAIFAIALTLAPSSPITRSEAER